jgi:Cof subfamily protein (haloacid dehalogenase superfamily)
MYKLICIDMDGTLLNSKRKISEASKDALKAAHNMGVQIVITTGRIYCNAAYYSDLIGVTSPVIAANGAIIREKDKEEPIYKCVIPQEVNLKILELCNKYKVYPNFQSSRDIYGGNALVSFILYYFVFKTKSKEHNVRIHGINSIEKWNKIFAKYEQEIIKCEIYDRDKTKISKITKALQELSELQVVNGGHNGVDITCKNVCKGTAVKALADYYKIRSEEVIAIGDNDNDIEMIEYAGLGVAMGNSKASIRDIADYVTATNDEDGVAKVINRFVLNKG